MVLAGGALDLLLLGEQTLELGIRLSDEGLDLLFGLRRGGRGGSGLSATGATGASGAAGRVETTRGRSAPAVSPTAMAASLAIFCSSVLL